MSARVERARALLDLRRPEQAVALLAAHLAEHPQDGDALVVLARARLQLGDSRGALTTANAAVAADPGDPDAHLVASLALSSCAQPKQALVAAQRAAELAPHAWVAHARLAEALAARRRHRRACAAALEAVRLAPDEAGAHALRGDVAAAAGHRKQARTHHLRALALDPEHLHAVNALGALDVADRRLLRAAGRFVDVAGAAPSSTVGATNLELTGWKIGRAAGALVLVSAPLVLPFLVPEATIRRRWAVLTALVVLVAAAAGAVWTARSLAPAARGYLLRRVVRSPWGVLAVCCLAAFGLTWLCVPFVSTSGRENCWSALLLSGVLLYASCRAGARGTSKRHAEALGAP